MSEKITDHAVQALDGMISFYWKADETRAIVQILTTRLQQLEDFLYDLLDKRLLENAFGACLDVIGRILGEPRGSLSDTNYRSVLQVVLAAYQSDGTAKEVINLAGLLLGLPVQYQQRGRACYKLQYETTSPLSGDWEERAVGILEEMPPAGVELVVVEADSSGTPFQLDTDGAGLDDGELCRRLT